MLITDIIKQFERIHQDITDEYERIFKKLLKEINDCSEKLPNKKNEEESKSPSASTCKTCSPTKNGVDIKMNENKCMAHSCGESTGNTSDESVKKDVCFSTCDKKDTCQDSCPRAKTCKDNPRRRRIIDEILPVTVSRRRAAIDRCKEACRIRNEELRKEELKEDRELQDAIDAYSEACEKIIAELPKGKDTPWNRMVLRAYFVLAVLINKINNPGIFDLYQEVFDIYLPSEYGSPTIGEKITNNYKLYEKFICLINRLHERDGRWSVEYKYYHSWLIGSRVPELKVKVSFLDKNLTLCGNEAGFTVGCQGVEHDVTINGHGKTVGFVISSIVQRFLS